MQNMLQRRQVRQETHHDPLQQSCTDQTKSPPSMVTRAFSRNKRPAVLIAVLLCAIIASSNILTHEGGLFRWKFKSKYWIPTGKVPMTFTTEGKNSASWAKHRSQKETLLIATKPKLAVLKLWDDYKSQHSNERLMEEWEHHQRTGTATNRNFTIGFYSCPLQAGNRLHHFLNAMMWAVITNRTLLWNYYDTESCHHVGKGFSRSICGALNTDQECSPILERAPWIPSSHWLNTFNLVENQPPELLPLWSIMPANTKSRNWKKGRKGSEKYQGLADTTKSRVVIFDQVFGPQSASALLKNKINRETLLLTDQGRERAVSLLSNGVEFLLGLLFRESFALRDDILPTSFLVDDTTPTDTLGNKSYSFATDHLTFALHSRHWTEIDDGSKIGGEVMCLEKMLENTSQAKSCKVFLMSDRPKSLQALTSYLHGRNDSCRAVVVANHTQGKSWTKEHGAFAGAGFFQDLYMASHARHGLAARHASSFNLVREIAEYDSHMEAIRNDRWPPPKLPFCPFPRKAYALEKH